MAEDLFDKLPEGGGDYDFSLIDPFLAAQRRHNILPIWDLCHYGFPDGLDPTFELVERHNRRFRHENASAPSEDTGVGGAEVDCEVAAEIAFEELEHYVGRAGAGTRRLAVSHRSV